MGVSINGGTPIAGWFISGKIALKWMMTRGTPIFLESSISKNSTTCQQTSQQVHDQQICILSSPQDIPGSAMFVDHVYLFFGGIKNTSLWNAIDMSWNSSRAACQSQSCTESYSLRQLTGSLRICSSHLNIGVPATGVYLSPRLPVEQGKLWWTSGWSLGFVHRFEVPNQTKPKSQHCNFSTFGGLLK